jgi:hypothetical protein
VRLDAAHLQDAHAVFGSPDQVIDQRRALYRAVLKVVSERKPLPELGDDVLDNPAVRGHVVAVLEEGVPLMETQCRSIAELVAQGCTKVISGSAVRLASTAAARGALGDALLRISSDLHRHDENAPDLALLTATDKLDHVFSQVTDGIELAVETAPALALDVLPHVSLFAVIVQDSAGRLGSASAREFPGLVLIPEPSSTLEVAEALIHEGAHQKFFDLATARALFGGHSHLAPRFSPSWAPAAAPSWSIEQTFAAWHAYCCLSAFCDALGDSIVHASSLVPHAGKRRLEIGDWLLAHGEYLGQDGHALLGAVLGRVPAARGADMPVDVGRLAAGVADGSLTTSWTGDRALVASRSEPVELFWIRAEDLNQATGAAGSAALRVPEVSTV